MRPEDVQLELRKQPFRPFRIHLTDGTHFDILHPELAVVGLSSIFIGRPTPGVDKLFYDDYVFVSVQHITRIEPLATGAATKANASGGAH